MEREQELSIANSRGVSRGGSYIQETCRHFQCPIRRTDKIVRQTKLNYGYKLQEDFSHTL